MTSASIATISPAHRAVAERLATGDCCAERLSGVLARFRSESVANELASVEKGNRMLERSLPSDWRENPELIAAYQRQYRAAVDAELDQEPARTLPEAANELARSLGYAPRDAAVFADAYRPAVC